MARMPGAEWKPLPRPSTLRMSRYDLVSIHTMVGSLSGTDGYFRRLTNGVNSHFGTGGGGEIWQWVDTAVRSGANGAGNHRCITIENADMGPGFPAWNTQDGNAVPAFTAAQLEANARICAWAHLQHGVPLVAADTSRPNARGIGFHRLGCNPWRVPDGELWSSSTGKTCPAPRRIAQIPQIIARARQIVSELGGNTPAPTGDWFDMATREDLAAVLRSEGVTGAGDAQHMLNHGYRQAMHDAVANVLRTEGVSGAGDHGRLLAVLRGSGLFDGQPADVDETALAAALAPLLVRATSSLSQNDLEAIGKAVADEQARRLAA